MLVLETALVMMILAFGLVQARPAQRFHCHVHRCSGWLIDILVICRLSHLLQVLIEKEQDIAFRGLLGAMQVLFTHFLSNI